MNPEEYEPRILVPIEAVDFVLESLKDDQVREAILKSLHEHGAPMEAYDGFSWWDYHNESHQHPQDTRPSYRPPTKAVQA